MLNKGEKKMLSEIKSEIKTIMNSVDDVYNVYTERNYIKEPNSFLNLFQAENILGDKFITAWFIRRISTMEKDFSTRENLREHTLILSGYLGIDENNNSSRNFETIIENICLAFREKDNLNNKCIKSTPVQVEKIEEKYLGSIFCHYAELKIICSELITN
jgi:hypothetical protein